jgi:hypothetical protein
MLDNLRDQASFQLEEKEPLPADATEQPKRNKRSQPIDRKSGLTAPQGFMLSLLLLVMVCLMGVVILVITGKVVLPFSL